MKKIDATIVVRRDGSWWYDPHWMDETSIDEPIHNYRVVDIQDGTGHFPPMIVYAMPNRPMPISQEEGE